MIGPAELAGTFSGIDYYEILLSLIESKSNLLKDIELF